METEKLKNLCAPIPAALHEQVRQRQGESGKNLGEYMTWLISVFGKSKCEQKGLQKVSTFSTRFYDVSKAFLGTKCSPFEYPGRRGLLQEWVPWGPNAHFGTQRPIALILSTLRVRPLAV